MAKSKSKQRPSLRGELTMGKALQFYVTNARISRKLLLLLLLGSWKLKWTSVGLEFSSPQTKLTLTFIYQMPGNMSPRPGAKHWTRATPLSRAQIVSRKTRRSFRISVAMKIQTPSWSAGYFIIIILNVQRVVMAWHFWVARWLMLLLFLLSMPGSKAAEMKKVATSENGSGGSNSSNNNKPSAFPDD